MLSLPEDLTREEEIRRPHYISTRAVDGSAVKFYFCGVCVCVYSKVMSFFCVGKQFCVVFCISLCFVSRDCSGQHFHGCLNAEKAWLVTKMGYSWVNLIKIMSPSRAEVRRSRWQLGRT